MRCPNYFYLFKHPPQAAQEAAEAAGATALQAATEEAAQRFQATEAEQAASAAELAALMARLLSATVALLIPRHFRFPVNFDSLQFSSLPLYLHLFF